MTTMKDVARVSGVSLSTVSYALNHTRPIREDTRQRVMAAIAQLGYTRNAAARTLAGRRSHVLALVVPPGAGGLGATMGQFLEGATATAESAGYTLVIWPFAKDQDAKVVDLARQRLADGVLVMEVAFDDQRIDALEQTKTPFTMIGRTRDLTDRSWVDIDFDAMVDQVVERLIGLGHRHVALINHSAAMLADLYGAAVRTRDAFETLAAQRGLVAQHLACDDDAAAGRAAVATILARDPATTAFLTLNETATFGVLAELAGRGLAVPVDASVVGLVTSPMVSSMSSPRLTSFQVPGHLLGRLAVQELVDLLEDRPRHPESRLIPCRYTAGESLDQGPFSPTTTKSLAD